MKIKTYVIDLLEDNPGILFTMDEMASALHSSHGDSGASEALLITYRSQMPAVIDELVQEGLAIRTKKNRTGHPNAFGLSLAQLRLHERGFGFAVVRGEERDLYIYEGNLGGAVDGDLVHIRNYIRRGKPEAEVVSVISRENSHFIGVYDGSGYIIPTDRKMYRNLSVKGKNLGAAVKGDTVIAEVLNWNEPDSDVYVKVTEVLGKKGDAGLDILSIARTYGLYSKFPPEVLAEADSLSDVVDAAGRTDFRDKNIFTIDGRDAKDLDDALHIELNEDVYEIGVHIADVSHYVKEGGAIDQEALSRATSVYLLDRVIPMLPERLSNDLCSLNEGADRYSLSIVMKIDMEGEVIDHKITPGIIRSKGRLNYEEVSDYLEGVNNPYVARISDFYADLQNMKSLAFRLRQRRIKRGAIDFDLPEAVINLDEKGRPTSIDRSIRRTGNMMIEEFMLIANETIAEHYFWLESPFIYRVHDVPQKEKIERLKKYIGYFGLTIKDRGGEMDSWQIAQLIDKIKGEKHWMAVTRVTLRSMMQAKYENKNGGHFGLASKYYCHFTAPIRRYPDLFIHRIIKKDYRSLDGIKERAAEIAEHSSERERNAEQAERMVESTKMAEFMLGRLGDQEEGVISSVTNFGFFVELDNLVDGLVHISTLYGRYEFEERSLSLVNPKNNHTFSIGDRVVVEVVDADPETGKIDFDFVRRIE